MIQLSIGRQLTFQGFEISRRHRKHKDNTFRGHDCCILKLIDQGLRDGQKRPNIQTLHQRQIH